MRELSRLENSSSAMPPKFMGRDADSVMRWSLAKVKARSQKPRINVASSQSARLVPLICEHLEPDSSGLPEGLLDQRFERWASTGVKNRSALQRAYHRS